MTSDSAEEWADALRAVPRAAFLPDLIWPFDLATGRYSCVSRVEDPAAWHAAVETDQPVTTQWDDGRHRGSDTGRTASSSCSMPSLVLDMLIQLDARPGMRVLEIGTGTGWSAALLTHRLGDGHVVTVEVDAWIAEQARANLRAAGRHVRVLTGDGAQGCPQGAPFDRVIATCGLRRVPWAWVEQTRPGGLLLLPWGTQYTSADALARLVVAEDGRAASGGFTGRVEFMKLRSQRLALAHADYTRGEWPYGADITRTRLGPEVLADTASFVIGLMVPDCAHVSGEQDGETVAWFYGLGDRSWAAARFTPGEGGGEVYQYGPRRLWDEVETAWHWWTAQGHPTLDRFGLTVTRDGEAPWLDRPGWPVGVVGR